MSHTEELVVEPLTTPSTQPAKSYAAQEAAGALGPWNFERRKPGPHDVQVDILFCGVCHTCKCLVIR